MDSADSMAMEDMGMSETWGLLATIEIGMITWICAATPVLAWFLYEKDRPGMS